MTLAQSKIDPQVRYDDSTEWVISYLNLGAALGGHAVLMLEGLDHAGTLEFRMCHIRACPVENFLVVSNLMLNDNNVACQAIVNTAQALPGKDFTVCYVECIQGKSRSYEEKTKRVMKISLDKGQALLQLIQAQEQEIRINAARACQDYLFKGAPIPPEKVTDYFMLYSKYGRRSVFTSGNRINCADWCDGQLEKLGINPMLSVSDATSNTTVRLPQRGAGGCVIQ